MSAKLALASPYVTCTTQHQQGQHDSTCHNAYSKYSIGIAGAIQQLVKALKGGVEFLWGSAEIQVALSAWTMTLTATLELPGQHCWVSQVLVNLPLLKPFLHKPR